MTEKLAPTVTVVSHREALESLSRILSRLSQSARFLALQARNDHVEVVVEEFPEMTGLLATCEEYLRRQ